MNATIRKLHGPFRTSATAEGAEIIPLHRRLSNEELRLHQYKIQKRMYDEAVAANQEMAITPEMLAVRHQPVREVSKTMAQQAAMQGEKGFAFKLY